MAKFSIGTQKRIKIHDADLRSAYSSEKTSISSTTGDYPRFDFSNLDCIFEVACKNKKLFPSINIDKGTPDDALVSIGTSFVGVHHFDEFRPSNPRNLSRGDHLCGRNDFPFAFVPFAVEIGPYPLVRQTHQRAIPRNPL